MHALIVYYSKYGQTRKIAARIAEVLRSEGWQVREKDVRQLFGDLGTGKFDLIVAGSPIYLGDHSREIGKFIRRNAKAMGRSATAFFSVSLSASGEQRNRDDAWTCVRNFLSKLNWKPDCVEIFAGGLVYRQYNWLIRWIMKRIVAGEHGDTDTSRDYDYTNWDRVAEFARWLDRNGRRSGNGREETESREKLSVP